MGTTFGERLHGAMLAAGLETAGELAEKLSLPRQTVAGWLKLSEATVAGTRLGKLARVLHVRVGWLIDGEGVAQRVQDMDSRLARAARIIEELAPDKCEDWLAKGEKIARK